MSEPQASTHQYQFAHARLDERNRSLLLNGHAVPLASKPFEVLLALLKSPGETLSKEELLELVWPGRVVTEGVLTKCILKLRAMLGDSSQQIISTVHGFGYRLDCAVIVSDATSEFRFEPRAGELVAHRPNWRLNHALGEGGHAWVWLAEHIKTGELRVFKYARDSAALSALKREVTIFRLLKQTLQEKAPITTIYDWNLQQAPYHLESPYITGGNLGEWVLQRAKLPLAARIALIAQCAEAVAMAHSVGVLHKDLKPANVLVDDSDIDAPKILLTDFGIGEISSAARLREFNITRQGFTQIESSHKNHTSGTPMYLAPELLRGASPSIASDVYSLGVMLYQCVIGDMHKPLGAGWEADIDDEILCADIAAAASVDVARRFFSATELAQHLRSIESRREQAQQQALAKQQSQQALVELEKALRKRQQWKWLAAGMSVILALLLGLVWQNYQSKQLIAAEAERAEAALAFLADDLLGQGDPIYRMGADLTLRELLDIARDKLESQFADQPLVAASIWRMLGKSYLGIGLFEPARDAFDRALAQLKRTDMAADASEYIWLYFDLGDLEVRLTNYAKATQWFEQGRKLSYQKSGALAADSVWFDVELAVIQLELANYPVAEPALLNLLEPARNTNNPALLNYVDLELALLDIQLLRFESAQARINQLHQRVVTQLGAQHAAVALVENALGRLRIEQQRYPDAIKILESAQAKMLQRMPAEHPQVLSLAGDLGFAYLRNGETQRADEILHDAATGSEKHLGINHHYARDTLLQWVECLIELKQSQEASELLERIIPAAEKQLGSQHPQSQLAKKLHSQIHFSH